MASFIGGTIGIIILTFTGPALADIGLKFGPSEMTALLLIAMTSISWLVGENPIKGVVITMLGILLASIGMDTLSGSPRYDFGSMYLLGGIPFTPFIIGTVGFSQVIKLVMERSNEVKSEPHMKLTIRGSILTKHDFKRLLPPALRSGVMGTFVGVLPGAGATTGAFMGYAAQKKFKNEEELGTGAIEGHCGQRGCKQCGRGRCICPASGPGHTGKRHWRSAFGRPDDVGAQSGTASVYQ